MNRRTNLNLYRRRLQRGAAAVEFALVAAFGGLFILFFGVIELGRVLFTMNAANEATAIGARTAIVCDKNDDLILTRMKQVMPNLKAANVDISYYPGGCAATASPGVTACESATVSIVQGMKIDTVIPFVPMSITLPAFTTTMTREAMNTDECV